MAWCDNGLLSQFQQLTALSLNYTLIDELLSEMSINESIVRKYIVKTYLSVGILFIRASQTVTSPLIGMVWFLSSSIRRARKHAWPSRAISANPFNPGRSITETCLLSLQEYYLIHTFAFLIVGILLFCYLNLIHSCFIPNICINTVIYFTLIIDFFVILHLHCDFQFSPLTQL